MMTKCQRTNNSSFTQSACLAGNDFSVRIAFGKVRVFQQTGHHHSDWPASQRATVKRSNHRVPKDACQQQTD